MTFQCVVCGAGAWLSHLMLDSFYNHGHGVAIYWPFSNGRLNFSISWFDTLDVTQSIISRHNLSVYAIEFAAYLPVLLTGIMVAAMTKRRSPALRSENTK